LPLRWNRSRTSTQQKNIIKIILTNIQQAIAICLQRSLSMPARLKWKS